MPRILTGLTLAAALIPNTLLAQANCADRSMVVERLASGYGESFQGGGFQNATRVFEIWFSEEKGTWTILMTQADGQTCIMASGTHWQGPSPLVQPSGVKS